MVKNLYTLMQLDELDRRILDLLQRDARNTLQDIARQVGLSAPGLQKRLTKLENSGLILGHHTLLNRDILGYDLLCFVQVHLSHHELSRVHQFREAVQHMPQVLECYHLTGDTDYLLKVVAKNRKDLEHFLVEVLTPAPGVDRIRTSLVLNEVKATTALPLELEVR